MSKTPFPSKKSQRDQSQFVAFVWLAEVGRGESCLIYLNAGYVIAMPVLYADLARTEI